MADWSVDESANAAVENWLRFKEEHPKLALALSVLPVSGQITAAAEFYDAAKRGSIQDAAIAALQFIPASGIIKGAKFAGEAMTSARHANKLADMAPIGADALSMRFAQDLRRMSDAEKALATRQAGRAGLAASADADNIHDFWKTQSGASSAPGGK